MPPGKPITPAGGRGTTAWRLWSHGRTVAEVAGITPLLASWESKTHPAQIRLNRYLDDLHASLGLLPDDVPLSLHMEIDVRYPERLAHDYDLENYLTPVVQRLGASRFVLASATKTVGGGSRLTIGRAQPIVARSSSLDGWDHFACHAGSGAARKEWKAGIRDKLLASRPRPLPPGAVAVHLAWRCSSWRNWSTLWKPTGDAMGPVLGEPQPGNPFNPADDRIVSLGLHRNIDDAVGHEVDVGMWWKAMPGAGQ